MKKQETLRKHGYKARAAEIARRLHLGLDNDRRHAELSPRLKTLVTFESSQRAYLWFTDRGRSRLIKH